MKEETFSLTLTGFKTKQQAEELLKWYEGQGEQDACVWLEESKIQGKIDVDFMPVDVSKRYVWEGNNLIAALDI